MNFLGLRYDIIYIYIYMNTHKKFIKIQKSVCILISLCVENKAWKKTNFFITYSIVIIDNHIDVR